VRKKRGAGPSIPADFIRLYHEFNEGEISMNKFLKFARSGSIYGFFAISCLFTAFLSTCNPFICTQSAYANENSDEIFSAGQRGFELEEVLPHNELLFTQGLSYFEGRLFESSGLYGLSCLSSRILYSTRPVQSISLDPDVFAEGCTVLGDKLYLLTWKKHELQIRDRESLRLLETRRYAGAGWGLTTDGRSFWQSNGSDSLFQRDIENFRIKKRLRVTDGGKPVRLLNELEWAEGVILANVWRSDRIAGIDPESGRVLFWLNIGDFVREESARGGGVANGIAWNEKDGIVYVTGKRWKNVYAIKMDDE